MGIFFHYITTGGTSMGELQPKLQTDSIQKQERTDNWFARAMNIRIGIIPLPIYILLFLLITVFVMSRDVKSDILTSIAVMSFSDLPSARSENPFRSCGPSAALRFSQPLFHPLSSTTTCFRKTLLLQQQNSRKAPTFSIYLLPVSSSAVFSE